MSNLINAQLQIDLPTEDLVEDTLVAASSDDTEDVPFEYSITSYGADYPVDGLVKRIRGGSIEIPKFQRGYVWTLKQASRFVESLLLGLPVPGVFLSREQESQKLLVIDGQQRLTTLMFFYEGIFSDTGNEFALKGLTSRFENKTYRTLDDRDRLKLDDSIIHATVFKQDEPEDNDSSIYNIFQRLNTGGTLLQPQEIRASIYHGRFAELLKDLNGFSPWRSIYGPPNKNMKDQELILRFLALYFNSSIYSKPMNQFLNNYMRQNKHLGQQSAETITSVFTSAVDTILRCVGNRAFKPTKALNAAVFDAIMVGLARRLEKGPVTDCDTMRANYNTLLQDDVFINATKSATADEDNVRKRVASATHAFAEVA